MKIDTRVVRGDFEKKAIVWSNDLERRSVALYLTGHVKPLVSLEPGGYVSLWGKRGSVPKEFIDITNNMKKPLQVIQIDCDLPEKIEWRLVEIKPGFAFRLEVGDKSEEAGDYTGHLYIHTDHPGKSILNVIVNGRIEPPQ